MGLYSEESVFRVVSVFHVTEVTGKILSDWNTCTVLLLCHLHSGIILIVIVTVIDIVTITVSTQ